MKKTAAPLGFLGDGQLALMLGESAEAQGFDFLGFGEDRHSSFARRFPKQFVHGKNNDSTAIIDFTKRCSVITLENEFFSSAFLHTIETESGTPLIPSSSDYRHFENKVAQREFYQSLQIDSPQWKEADAQSIQPFPFPLVLKSIQGGYDGYGVRIVADETKLATALRELNISGTARVLVEEKVEIKMELAQGALFDGSGNLFLLPLVETIQKNGTCEIVLSKPRLDSDLLNSVSNKIKNALQKIAGSKIMGLFNFEFFLTQDHRVLMNEGAPRPHNSQHLTLNASPLSQFDLLVQFLVSKKLPTLESPLSIQSGAMINLLGKSTGQNYELKLPTTPAGVAIFPKLYLKQESRVGRKMGHLNLVDQTETHDLVKISEQILKEYRL